MTHIAEDHGGSEPESKAQRTLRQHWEDAFLATGSAAHDELLLDAMPLNKFDRAEW